MLVTLGLNVDGLAGGARKTEQSFKRIRDDADRTAKELDFRGKQAASFFSQIRNQFVGLLAAFTAGAGLTHFAEAITNIDAAAGRMAKNIGVSSDELTAWQGVAERSGGSAEGITQSMFGLTQQFQQLALTGQSAVVPYFRAVGVMIADTNGKMRPMRDILLDLADKFSHMSAAEAQALGAGMGIDQGTINVLMKGRDAVRALLAEQEKLGHATEADTKAAIARQAAWAALVQTSEDLGRKIMTTLTPAILQVTKYLTQLGEWARQHQPLVMAIFVGLATTITALTIALLAPLAELIAIAAAIGAAIGLIAFLFDDWKTFTEGGKAAFGDFWTFMMKAWNDINAIVEPILKSLGTVFGDVVTTLKDYLTFLKALFFGTGDEIRAAWGKVWEDIKKEFFDLIDLIKTAGPIVAEAFKSAFSAAFNWVEDRAYAIWNAITHRHDTPPNRAGSSAAPDAGGAPGGGGGANLPGASGNAQDDIDKLMKMGWTRQQAAGIAASIQRESSGNPNAIGDNGNAYGLFQWHKDRQAAFAAWAGHDIRQSTRDEQLAFINYELIQGNERAAGSKLRAVNDARAAGEIVSSEDERPADRLGEMQKRGDLASHLFAGIPADSGLTTGTTPTAVAAASTTNNGGNTSTSTHEVNVNGDINIHTQASDAQGIAGDIGKALEKYSIVPQANTGLDN